MRPWTIPILGVVALSLAIPSGAEARLRFGPGVVLGALAGGDVRRLPTFVQTPPPTARSIFIGSPAPRCALGAAPGGQHAATRSERASTGDEPAAPTQRVSRADRSDILA